MMKGTIEYTEEGIITEIIKQFPELQRKNIEIIETQLLSPEGIKIHFETKPPHKSKENGPKR